MTVVLSRVPTTTPTTTTATTTAAPPATTGQNHLRLVIGFSGGALTRSARAVVGCGCGGCVFTTGGGGGGVAGVASTVVPSGLGATGSTVDGGRVELRFCASMSAVRFCTWRSTSARLGALGIMYRYFL